MVQFLKGHAKTLLTALRRKKAPCGWVQIGLVVSNNTRWRRGHDVSVASHGVIGRLSQFVRVRRRGHHFSVASHGVIGRLDQLVRAWCRVNHFSVASHGVIGRLAQLVRAWC